LINKLQRKFNNRVFDLGISVGCRTRQKEMKLLKTRINRNFIIFELCEVGIKYGMELAALNL
jgi:hypothetical protein